MIPTFMADQFAAVCGAQDPLFLSELTDIDGSMAAHVQHVKAEIIAEMPEHEATAVLVLAADTARAVTREELRALVRNDPADEAVALNLWCRTSAKTFVVGIVQTHHTKHREFVRLLGDAKTK